MPAATTTPSDRSPEGMMSAIADRLVPLFASDTVDPPSARRMALVAIEEYRPEASIDFVNIARTLAFSVASIELLRQAGRKDLPLKEQMRIFSRANALTRSADQSERTMMQRRKNHRLQAAAARRTRPPEPVLSQATVEAAVAEAMAVHDELQAQAAPPPPAPSPVPTINPDPPATQIAPPPPPPAPVRKPGIDFRPPATQPASIHYGGPCRPVVPPVTTAQLRADAMCSAAYIPVNLLAGVGPAPNLPPPRP